MSDGRMQDAAGVNIRMNPMSFQNVPVIHFNDSSPPTEDPTVLSCIRPAFRKPYFRQSEDNPDKGVHLVETPSPLSSSPESTSFANNRKNQYSADVPRIKRSGNSASTGFLPIKCGSAGDSDDDLSCESDVEISSEKPLNLPIAQHLHPYSNFDIKRNGSQFRRHSWIW